MRVEDLKELRGKLASLPEDKEGSEQVYAEFGYICATKYIPQLLRAAGLNRETPEFEQNPCDTCYWAHQTVRIGCGHCVDKSEYVYMFSNDASKMCEKYFQAIRDTQ